MGRELGPALSDCFKHRLGLAKICSLTLNTGEGKNFGRIVWNCGTGTRPAGRIVVPHPAGAALVNQPHHVYMAIFALNWSRR